MGIGILFVDTSIHAHRGYTYFMYLIDNSTNCAVLFCIRY
jgi:hypothetical protein